MNSLLTEVGRKLADRWLSALVLPGALFVAAAMCGWWLGHPHALDTGRLEDTVRGAGMIRDVDAMRFTFVGDSMTIGCAGD
ncbi:hypothetical protein ACWCPL_42845, partial [Streptomyces sp. NPDC001948]